MKRKRRKTKRRLVTIPVWTYAQAKAAVPYLKSIMRSLRTHQIDAQGHDLAVRRLTNRPGRPDRKTLVAHADAVEDTRQARERYHEAEQELQSLGVFCLDAVRGEALIPFVQDEQLAWFILDTFAPEPLQSWRFHSDSLETRRPLGDVEDGETQTAQAV